MKKVLLIFLSAAFLAACSGGPGDTPEAVAEKFLNHMQKLEFSQAKDLGTEDTKELLSLLESFAGGMSADDIPDAPAIEYVNCNEDGDKADCTYCCDENGAEADVQLRKVGGKWLVHMSKEEAFGDMDDMNWDDDFDWDDDEWDWDEEDYDAEY